MSHRHMEHAIRGWRVAVQTLAGAHPSLGQIAVVVHEAEPWLARFRLMRMGRLRLVRWHAIGGG